MRYTTSLQVTDSKGHMLFQKESATKGKFAFTTEEYDMFEICFMSSKCLQDVIWGNRDT